MRRQEKKKVDVLAWTQSARSNEEYQSIHAFSCLGEAHSHKGGQYTLLSLLI